MDQSPQAATSTGCRRSASYQKRVAQPPARLLALDINSFAQRCCLSAINQTTGFTCADLHSEPNEGPLRGKSSGPTSMLAMTGLGSTTDARIYSLEWLLLREGIQVAATREG